MYIDVINLLFLNLILIIAYFSYSLYLCDFNGFVFKKNYKNYFYYIIKYSIIISFIVIIINLFLYNFGYKTTLYTSFGLFFTGLFFIFFNSSKKTPDMRNLATKSSKNNVIDITKYTKKGNKNEM